MTLQSSHHFVTKQTIYVYIVKKYNRVKVALNRSSEFKSVTGQSVYAVAIQFESAWAFTKIASGTTCCA